MTIKEVVGKFGRVIERNSPYILTGLAVAGTISTAILAVEVTPKALKIIEESQCETNKDKIIVAWKCYIPAGIVCLTTVMCIIGVNTVYNRRNAALAGLYSLVTSTLKEYQEKVIQTIGENKERKIRDEIDADRVLSNPTTDVIFTGFGDVLCYDSTSGRYFTSDIETIKKVINEINRNLLLEMFIPLNDLYYELGLESTKLGYDLGFNIDNGLLEVNFSSNLTKEGRPCLVLNYEVYAKHL